MTHDSLALKSDRIGRPVCSLMVIVQVWILPVHAQVSGYGKPSAPMYGGSSGFTRPANPFLPNGAHKTPDGRLCISVHPSAHPQTINPKIIDQIVLVENICGQSIRVQVCYTGSSDCIIVPLAGYQRLQRTLGIASGSTYFRYEFHELP
ncbi:hypothetical protein [Bradyrhizobium sp. CCGUVB23]|uniref:hypothetical protein n=1 Tax=Bradyrhizobium sp. CCGUVB23 TaxID=2949630 RepID=UPI0020B35BC4|nr:hypothetical protein [Bradyrhizobium sp. CCGUVB23]MCP3460077.1 hypothetical protein [Bradyrhizobium sp. CCGUVB23]